MREIWVKYENINLPPFDRAHCYKCHVMSLIAIWKHENPKKLKSENETF